jgi:hypothetical protein
MFIDITCPSCGHRGQGPESLQGHQTRCPNCGHAHAVEPHLTASAIIPPRTASAALAKHDAVDGLAIATDELWKNTNEFRGCRRQHRWNRARARVLRMHRWYLESFGLSDAGWLLPSLILALPAFGIGAVLSPLFQSSLAVSLLIAGLLLAVVTAFAGLYYWTMPYNRIVRELEGLDEQNEADRQRLNRLAQHRNELGDRVEKTKRFEMQQAYRQQQLEYRHDLEEAAKIRRLRSLLGHQEADSWGTVAIFFSCTALVLAILGLFTCGITYLVALPFAFMGLIFALLSKGDRKAVALTLSILTFAPLILALVLFAGAR